MQVTHAVAARRAPWLSLLALVVPALVGGAGAGSIVIVDSFRLDPRQVTVPVGESVTFVMDENQTLTDSMLNYHLVGEDGVFRSPALAPGERWTIRFERPGLYRYHLEHHPSVEGSVLVE